MGSRLAKVPYEITAMASLYGILTLNSSPEIWKRKAERSAETAARKSTGEINR